MPGQTGFDEGFHEPEKITAKGVAVGGFSLEAICGIGAVILGIIGLAGVFPMHLGAISIIALGLALLGQGAAIAARYPALLKGSGSGVAMTGDRPGLRGGVATEFIGGVAGIVLGVLALLAIAPLTLMAVALLVFGTTLLLSRAEMGELTELEMMEPGPGEHGGRTLHAAASATAGGQILIGLAALLLGILALTGGIPMTLILVGVLCLGLFLLFNGGVVAGRLMGHLKA